MKAFQSSLDVQVRGVHLICVLLLGCMLACPSARHLMDDVVYQAMETCESFSDVPGDILLQTSQLRLGQATRTERNQKQVQDHRDKVAAPTNTTDLAVGPCYWTVHKTVSLLLCLFVGFVMTVFYLVNYPDEDIQNQAWQLLSRTISIFIAVLMYKSTKTILCEALHQSCENNLSDALSADFDPHGEVDFGGILTSFGRWIIFWLLFQVYLFWCSGSGMVATSKLGGHIVAFSGLDAFTALQAGKGQFEILRANPLNSLCCTMAVGVVLWLILEGAGLLRRCYASRRRRDQGAARGVAREWMKECSAAENEAASLIVGLLLSQTIRHAISGAHPPIHGGDPKGKSSDQVIELFVIAIGLGALVMKLGMILRSLLSSPRHKKGIGRMIRVIVDTVSMAMAWSLLYWGEWFIYNRTNDRGVGEGDRMTILLVVAGVLSAFAFATIFVIVYASRHSFFEDSVDGLNALSVAIGLVVGCAWEDVFIEAIGGVREMKLLDLKASYSTLVFICFLCAVTLPGWMLYILPRGELVHDSHNKRAGVVIGESE
mmetsp:Transcript_70414/g.111310  ORF Transcript_70414/g.111310 Transcript_70414/m.111310 type:complete len:544 (+) Transcript_70414:107-1738(+)